MDEQDLFYMRLALQEANLAYQKGEVPVGAVLVRDGSVLGTAHNLRESLHDPTAHAETMVLRTAALQEQNWRLLDTTLYVTKEPCIMCAGTIINSRVSRLVYGCRDLKAGAVESLYKLLTDSRLNHRVTVVSGLLEEECASLLRIFFQERR